MSGWGAAGVLSFEAGDASGFLKASGKPESIADGEACFEAGLDVIDGPPEGHFVGLQVDYELMERRRAIADELKTIRPRAV